MPRRLVCGLFFLFALVVFVGSAFVEPAFAECRQGSITVVTLGDSITKGVRTGVSAQQTFASLLQQALRKENPQASVVNVGIGGERTDQALRRLERDVVAKNPQVATIMYGTNDSYVDIGKQESRITAEAYRKNLEELVARLRKAGIKPILMTEPRWGEKARNNGAGEHPNLRLEKYVEQCRQVARDLKVPLVDHFKIWTDKERQGTVLGRLTTDQCHPNPAGHQLLLDTMLPVVQEALGQGAIKGD